MALIFDDQRSDTTSPFIVHKGGDLSVQVEGLDNGVVTPGTLNGALVHTRVKQDTLADIRLSNGTFAAPDIILIDMEPGTLWAIEVVGLTANFGVTVSRIGE